MEYIFVINRYIHQKKYLEKCIGVGSEIVFNYGVGTKSGHFLHFGEFGHFSVPVNTDHLNGNLRSVFRV